MWTNQINAYLARYSDVFVRVGHGIFGLAEWGLSNDGSLANAVYRVISEARRPLHIDNIARRVLQTWRVNPDSVYAAIQQDERFEALGRGIYTIVESGFEQMADDDDTLIETNIVSTDLDLSIYSEKAQQWEQRIWELLKDEKLIGELPISQKDFEEICSCVQTDALDHKDHLRLNKVPPALFIVTMVFAARYAESEARNFWQPYAKLVWKNENASLLFQNNCRDRFHEATRFLTQKFNLNFLAAQKQYRIVSPIYRHTVIPAYLQDDFTRWLLMCWQTVLESDDYRSQLRQKIEEQKVPLRNFLNSEETRASADEIVTNMATILQLYYEEGITAEDVVALLGNRPIELELWQLLLNQIENKKQTPTQTIERQIVDEPKHQAIGGRLCWIWSLDDNELRLRLTGTEFDRENKPARIEWEETDVVAYIDPWTMENGNWFIDEVELSRSQVGGGKLIIYDEDDVVLGKRDVPLLPMDSALFFRPLETVARYVAHERVRDGEWYVCLGVGTRLLDEIGAEIMPSAKLLVPDGLDLASAGIYQIVLPISVVCGDEKIEIESKGRADIRPKLIPERPTRIPNLSKNHPVFTDKEINLIIDNAPERWLRRATLRLSSGKRPQQYQVSELDGVSWVNEQLQIPLGAFLDPAGGMYEVQLFEGGERIFSDPMQFGILPGVSASPVPDTFDTVYTPKQLPICQLQGVTIDQIVPHDDRFTISEKVGGFQIKWHDLRDGCRVQIKVNEQVVTLVWDILRYFAWMTPTPQHGYLTVETFQQSVLNVVAPSQKEKAPYDYIEWLHLCVGEEKRKYTLPRKGRVHIPLRNDPLRDILEQAEQPSNIVTIQMREVRWPIVEVRRFPDIKQVQVDYDVMGDDCNVIFSCQLDAVWEGPFEFFLQALHRPFDSPIKLLETNYLKELIIFPIRLTDGHYFLDICYDGESLPLPNQTSSIIVGDGQNKLQSPNYRKLLNYLRGKEKGMVESSYAADFVRILADHADTIQLTPQHLYQLATLSVSSYENLPMEKLEALWRPLAQLATLQDVKQWHNRYGMLPAWIVTNNGLSMSTIESGRRIQITPLGLLLKGKWGVGEIFLKSSDNNRKRVYARWEPAQNNDEIRLTMFWFQDTQIEQDDYSALTQEFVEGDGSSVYLCKSEDCSRCFILHPKYVSSFDDPLVKQHLHNRRQSVSYAHELFYDMSSEGIPITVRPTEHAKSTLTDESVKPTQVKLYLQDVMALPPVIGESHSPISHDVHEQATWQWVKRYRDDPVAKKELDRLAYTYRWQDSLKQLQGLLLKHDVPRTVYLLETLWQDEPLENLDCDIVLLAFLLRYTSYKPDEMRDLCQQIGLVINDLVDMLEIANHYCPELLLWAMNWIELFHLHGI